MEKENKKLKSEMMKEEKQRLVNLVNQAYKNDPRIKDEEERKLKEKAAIKQARAEQSERERLANIEFNNKLKFEYEEKCRKEKEALEKLKETLYNELLGLFEYLKMPLTDSDKFQILINRKADILKSIINEVESQQTDEDKVKRLKTLVNEHYKLKFVDEVLNSTIWKLDDLLALQKAMKKFPLGTRSRWERIGELIKSKPQSQIIELAHYLSLQPTIKFDQDFVISFNN
jgi:hypothetical protein